ncbi:hypothetical protein VTK56DRAFT_4081 [Thermocarpiscus australiensis]
MHWGLSSISEPVSVRSNVTDNTIYPYDSVSGAYNSPASPYAGSPLYYGERSPPQDDTGTVIFAGSRVTTPHHMPNVSEDFSAAADIDVPSYMSPEHKSEVTEVSYYSMANLSDTNPLRRVPAATVRAQAAAVPDTILPTRHGYPHPFHNRESPDLTNPANLVEHPLTPDEPWRPGTPPGPARILINEGDRSSPEVGYHDPTKPIPKDGKFHPFTLALCGPASRGSGNHGLSGSTESTGL